MPRLRLALAAAWAVIAMMMAYAAAMFWQKSDPIAVTQRWIAEHCSGGGWEFKPQPDITTYQLAEILSRVKGVWGGPVCVSAERPIPDDLKRHFARLD